MFLLSYFITPAFTIISSNSLNKFVISTLLFVDIYNIGSSIHNCFSLLSSLYIHSSSKSLYYLKESSICKNVNIKTLINPNKKVYKKAGIINVNLKTSSVNTHMLRHTFATRCIEAGVSAVALSRILGHKDIQTTLNTYTSVFNKFKEDELAKINKYFDTI